MLSEGGGGGSGVCLVGREGDLEVEEVDFELEWVFPFLEGSEALGELGRETLGGTEGSDD